MKKSLLTPFALSTLILVCTLAAFGWATVSLLVDVYQGVEDYSHGFVVPLVSLYAAYEIRKKYPHESYTPSWWGVPVVGTGATLVVVGLWYRYALLPGGLGVQCITGLGLLIVIYGLSLSLGGKALVARFIFPLLFLCFCVPLPENMTNQITLPLRSVVSTAATRIVRECGIPVFQEGNMLHLATTSLGVADACSGIRSLWIMLATAAAFGYFLCCGPLRTLLLSAMAIPLAVLFNIIRVVATALMVAQLGPQYAMGSRHEMTGAVVFLLGVMTLVAIGWILARGEQKAVAARGPEVTKESSGVALPWRMPQYLLVTSLGIILVGGGIIQPVMARHYVRHLPLTERKPFKDMPNHIGNFAETGSGEFVESQLDLLRPTDRLNRTYRTEQGTLINLWSLYWEPYRGKKSGWSLNPHKPDGCYPAAGWNRLPIASEKLVGIIPGRDIQVRLFAKDGRKRLLLYFTSQVDAPGGLTTFPATAAGRFRQMLESWHSPDVLLGAQYVVTVETDVTTDLGVCLGEVTDFVKRLAPLLPSYGVRG